VTKAEVRNLPASVRHPFDGHPQYLRSARHRAPGRLPVALPEIFVADPAKQRQWSSFLSKSGMEAPELPEIARLIEAFLSRPTFAAARHQGFRAKWTPPGPWRDPKSG